MRGFHTAFYKIMKTKYDHNNPEHRDIHDTVGRYLRGCMREGRMIKIEDVIRCINNRKNL